MIEENIIKVIIEKNSWEEIIYHVISIENIDPWNIDLVRLCDGFISFLNRARNLDFRIPAKVILIAAILLKLKSEYLFFKEEEMKEENKEKIEVQQIQPIEIKIEKPIRRIAKGPITIDDLIRAMKKIVELKEEKERRIWERKRKVEIKLEEAKNFELIIENLYNEIVEILSKKDKITFRELVVDWVPEKIVGKFLPLIHLENKKRVNCIQEDFFKDIYIYLPTQRE